MLLDLGGIAVDCAFDQIAHKVDNLIVNAGGDCRIKRWQDAEIAIKSSIEKAINTSFAKRRCSVHVTTRQRWFLHAAKAL